MRRQEDCSTSASARGTLTRKAPLIIIGTGIIEPGKLLQLVMRQGPVRRLLVLLFPLINWLQAGTLIQRTVILIHRRSRCRQLLGPSCAHQLAISLGEGPL